MSLVSHFPLHGNPRDVHGTNDGTNNGATETSGILGNSAYDFTASESDYIDIGNLGDFGSKMDTGFSISLFGSFQDNGVILHTENSGSTTQIRLTIGGLDADNGELSFFIRDESGNDISIATTENYLNSGFRHIVFNKKSNTVDGLEIFVDGINQPITQERTGTLSNPANFSGSVIIGAKDSSSGLGSYIDGQMSNFRIHDHALSELEVQYLYEVSQRGQIVSPKKVA